MMPPKIWGCGRSHIGKRSNNEDVWTIIPGGLGFLLADGMGGHRAGEIAAREAVNSFCEEILAIVERWQKQSQRDKPLIELIDAAFHRVNRHVFSLSQADTSLKGMGTTLCLLIEFETEVIYGHVGDSRIYRFREKQLSQLTKDHSLLNKMIDLGELKEEDAPTTSYRNILWQAIGTSPTIEPAVRRCERHPDDIYILCSDGLSDVLDHEEMEDILNKHSFHHAMNRMVDLAVERGTDNITAVMCTWNTRHE